MSKLTDFLAYHPLSESYVVPPGKTARELVNLLIARQKTVYNQTIVESGIPRIALIKHMKKLMKTYSLEDIKRGIDLSVINSDYPVSIKYVEEMILWRKDLINYQPYQTSE